MAMNQHPLHIDEQFAAGTQYGQRLVVGPLVISIVIGLTQADMGGRALQVLEYSDVQHVAPVFHGDTLYAESTVLDLDSENGKVTVETRGLNQRRETVLTLQRTFIAPCRPVMAATS